MTGAPKIVARINPDPLPAPVVMAERLVLAGWDFSPEGFSCDDTEANAVAVVLLRHAAELEGEPYAWAARRLYCGEMVAAAEAHVESFYRRVFHPDEQPSTPRAA